MKEQKNIERLFQEKFKDFEALPPQDTWNTIASRLNEKKKKKRVIPFWFQLSGIAASLILVGTLIWNYQAEDTISTTTTNVVIVEDTIKDDLINSNEVITNVEGNQNSSTEKNQIEIDKKLNEYKIEKLANTKNNIVNQSKEVKKEVNIGSEFEKSNLDKITISKQNNVSNNKNKDSRNNSNSSNDFLTKKEINNSIVERLVSNQKETISEKKNLEPTEVLIQKEDEKTKYTNNNKAELKENNRKKPIVSSNETSFKDSTLVAEIAKELNPLEEMLLAKEDGKNEIEKEKVNKWAISTNASPVYFNSIAQGSSLDEEFESNKKKFATTFSYGVSGSYAISKKMTFRAGVNNINLSYNTNEILYQTKLSPTVADNIPTISRNANANNVTFISEKNSIQSLNGDVENIAQRNSGALKQDIGYIEVPLELTYKLVDKKFGIEVIGGLSTLFLNLNSVSLVTDGMEMEVGKANNLNNIHFSSNVGLGFKYNFWGNFNANFQPMFKYQINTFNENSGNFKPYFIGLYSGISFSF